MKKMAKPLNPMPQEVQLALGRLFRMLARPSAPGDVDVYHSVRAIIMNGVEVVDRRPNYARDFNKGAQGD